MGKLPRKVERRIAYVEKMYDEDMARRYREAYLANPTKTDRELLEICGKARLREEHEADVLVLKQRCTT
jgi:hypothetical protein